MRTTLNLDDDVYSLARSLAEARRMTLGEAVSYLARRGATAQAPFTMRNGFPIFVVEPETPQFGPEEIRAALDAEDAEYAVYLREPKPQS